MLKWEDWRTWYCWNLQIHTHTLQWPSAQWKNLDYEFSQFYQILRKTAPQCCTSIVTQYITGHKKTNYEGKNNFTINDDYLLQKANQEDNLILSVKFKEEKSVHLYLYVIWNKNNLNLSDICRTIKIL